MFDLPDSKSFFVDLKKVEALFKSFAEDTTTRAVKISIGNSKKLKKKHFKTLRASLKTNSTLKYIRFDGCIDQDGAIAIGEILADDPHLVKVDMFRNTIGKKAGIALAKGLRSNTKLRSLGLEECYITSDGLVPLVDTLLDGHPLTDLNLRCNKLTDTASGALARLLSSDCQIQTLNLSNNPGLDSGPILTAMTHNRSVLVLKYTGNEVGRTSAYVLASMVKDNKFLRYLDISGNEIKENEGLALVKALSENTTLQGLRADNNAFGDSVGQAFVSMLAGNVTLVSLSLYQTKMQKTVRDQLEALSSTHPSLTDCRCHDCDSHIIQTQKRELLKIAAEDDVSSLRQYLGRYPHHIVYTLLGSDSLLHLTAHAPTLQCFKYVLSRMPIPALNFFLTKTNMYGARPETIAMIYGDISAFRSFVTESMRLQQAYAESLAQLILYEHATRFRFHELCCEPIAVPMLTTVEEQSCARDLLVEFRNIFLERNKFFEIVGPVDELRKMKLREMKFGNNGTYGTFLKKFNEMIQRHKHALQQNTTAAAELRQAYFAYLNRFFKFTPQHVVKLSNLLTADAMRLVKMLGSRDDLIPTLADPLSSRYGLYELEHQFACDAIQVDKYKSKLELISQLVDIFITAVTGLPELQQQLTAYFKPLLEPPTLAAATPQLTNDDQEKATGLFH